MSASLSDVTIYALLDPDSGEVRDGGFSETPEMSDLRTQDAPVR
jgi:hypothetical protein